MALQARLLTGNICQTFAPLVCTRGMLKQARLNKLCNFTGPQDRDDDGWVKIIGYYGKDTTPHVGNVVKVRETTPHFGNVVKVRDHPSCWKFSQDKNE